MLFLLISSLSFFLVLLKSFPLKTLVIAVLRLLAGFRLVTPVAMATKKKICVEPAVENAAENSILDLPELTMELILEKLSPVGLCNMAGVCSSLRERCRSDYLWERHMGEKWGKVIGGAARRQWELYLASKKETSAGRGGVRSWAGALACLWPLSLIKSIRFDGKMRSPSLPDESIMSWYLAQESSMSTSVRESLSSSGFEEPKKSLVSDVGGDGEKASQKVKPKISDMEMMKDRFSKLLLGEDMSGCGNGVSTALAISNSITNLCATIFGQLWRLEPISPEKKCMWRREMDWLLCVSDHIVELVPSWQTFPDGSKLEVMTCRPRSDLYINLPALRKLDNMLLEILDDFKDPEFWYVDQGVLAPEIDGSASFRRSLKHQEEKWWLPVPRIPSGGLKSSTRKLLQDKRECTNQILKAALAINSNALVEMEVPESYIDSLPKNGRASLGDIMYRYIISDQFFPECLLDCLCLSSEYQALEIANRVEASIYIWRRGIATNTKSSWGMVKDLVLDAEKRELLADRAEGLLLCLKQRFPGLTQTALDTSKIQFNKDVGKSILESYSRVLESLAFNIVARIDDLLHVDDLAKHLDQAVGAITYNRVSNPQSVPISSTPYSTAYATPNFSPAPLISPARTSLIRRKSHSQGFRVKKALTDYLGIDTKAKHDSNVSEVSVSIRE